MGDINETILAFRQREEPSVMVMYNRAKKLIKISNYMPCRILKCACRGWTCDEKIKQPQLNTPCAHKDCKHGLCDHISHLINASENMLNSLMRLIFDFENVRDEIEYLSTLPSDDQKKLLLQKCKEFVYHEIKNFISPDSLVVIKDPIEIVPFESPTIIEILKNFCLYKFLLNPQHVKVAFQIVKMILKSFDQWVWYTSEELSSFNRIRYNRSYESYYQKYKENFLFPNSIQSLSRPRLTSSMVFGQDVLRYTIGPFRTSIAESFLNEINDFTFSKRCVKLKMLPRFLELFEFEVYALDSPIWNLNHTHTPYPKNVLDNLNSKLTELIQNHLNETIMHLNEKKTQGRIYKSSCLTNGVVKRVPDENYNNYVLIDKLIEAFESMCIDFGPNTSLKGFMTDQNKSKTQIKDKNAGIEMMVFDCKSNFTKCVLCRKELKKMYLTRLPRLSDICVTKLEKDKQIQTLAMLEDGVPVGGIYFRTFKSQRFTEIILSVFKIDLHANGYESRLMSYLKDYNIKNDIWDLLVYADKGTFEFFNKQNFSPKVKIPKTVFNKHITHYGDSYNLMHCNLKK
ncbi:histone acetyltransferase KAT2A-like [Melanaphis sacchari]|uniref:histone acetyltransferase KAT2A-like n=1 Tax=Melanaphis sacchari TaxID=742174 RepID=UPI000DC13014|nr:histone acetyltransferase KAT2A-like [Melanaphis sacchari]